MIAQKYAQQILNRLLLTNTDFDASDKAEEANKYKQFNIAGPEDPEKNINCFQDFSALALKYDLYASIWKHLGNEGRHELTAVLEPQGPPAIERKYEKALEAAIADVIFNSTQAQEKVKQSRPVYHTIVNEPVNNSGIKDTDCVIRIYYRTSEYATIRNEEFNYYQELQDGWRLTPLAQSSTSYPQNSYLGLFVTDNGMPDANGENYLEPSGENTTYQRVNLLKDFVLQSQCLIPAQLDENTGATYVTNEKQIIFPEIEEIEWGDIVGFGIFSEAQGGIPILWGRLQQPISGELNHVPLFRINNFKITLSDSET